MISKFYTNFDGATVELLHIGPKNGQHHRRTAGPCSAHVRVFILHFLYYLSNSDHSIVFHLEEFMPGSS